jgi:PTS system nitrogen regulatory IIA component
MKFQDLLTPEAVKVVGAASSKKRLIHDLGDLAASAHNLPSARVIDALMEREALGPTGVGDGVALPRIAGLNDVCGVFVRLEKPIDFDAVDRQPVDLVFSLFAPEEAGVEHLKALALVSRTLRDAGLRSKLRANGDAGTLYTILTATEAVAAA